MKMIKNNSFKGMSRGALRAKLMSTVAMLLVASTLLVTSSYAWFVMSTAPEVTGIDTQVGANGALEIALLNADSWANLDNLDMGDIDESATGALSTVAANLTWGNLVNLADQSYGLSKIALMPARLAINESGTAGEEGARTYTVNDYLLKTPVYREDGRVKELSQTTQTRIYEGESFKGVGYGVRAIGNMTDMNVYQLGMNNARAQLSNYMAAARTAASNALTSNGGDLAGIVVRYVLQNQTTGYTKDDITAVKNMTVGLQQALTQIENALRQAYVGYVATADAGLNEQGYQEAVAYITSSDTKLSDIREKYPKADTVIQGGETNSKKNLSGYVDELLRMQREVSSALKKCEDALAIEPTGDEYTWGTISNIVSPLLNTSELTMRNNKTGTDDSVETVKSAVIKNGELQYGEALAYIPITLGVPTGSGIISDVADFADNYTAKVDVRIEKIDPNNPISVTMATATTQNPVYLRVCLNCMASAALQGTSGSQVITDFYGYAIDLAFRTNAAKNGDTTSGLRLQTDAMNRVYQDGSTNEALQGGGSYMTFKATSSTLSATKMVKLMDGIRVVFLDKERNVLALAKLDMTLGQDMYQADGDTGNYYLTAWGESYTHQTSDVIDGTVFRGLGEKSEVEFNTDAEGNKTVKAKLYLYTFEMPDSTANPGKKTGALNVISKKNDSVITKLTPDVAKVVTAVVYLDGSKVTNATVAADAAQSMTGTLNLQFNSDADLVPAEITALRESDRTGG